jgi:hypothetical protein
LFQIQEARGLHSGSALFLWKSTHHLGDFFKKRPLQGLSSKEPGPSLFHHARPEKQGGFWVQPRNTQELVDAGPTRFHSDMTTSRGFWPSPWTEAGRGTTTATLNPSRIGQTSRTPIGKYLLYLD